MGHSGWDCNLLFFIQKVGKIVIYKLYFYLSFEVEISVYIRSRVLHFKQITLMDFGFSQCLGTLLTRNYTRGNIYCRYTCTGVVCLRKFSSFVCEVKWENEKNIFLCVLEWREFISLVRTRVVLLLIFIHGWLLLFTFTLGSCLQVMSNWEKRQKNLLYENILEILDSHTVVWGTYVQFGLRVEKVVIFFCLHSQPSLFLYHRVRHFCRVRRNIPDEVITYFVRKSIGRWNRTFLWDDLWSNDNAQGELGQQQRNTLSCNYRELTPLWEQRTFSFLDSK